MANQKTKASQKLKDIRLYYVTTPNVKVARSISNTLLKENLIACSNIIPKMESHYFWQGKKEVSNETILILKSSKRLTKELVKRIPELHPYKTPCILEIPVQSASEAYGLWLHSHLK